MPEKTGASYQVELHQDSNQISGQNRSEYFSNINGMSDQVLFLDPDNGFEPEKSINEKHVGYSDISDILEQISEKSIVSVFSASQEKIIS